MFELYTSKYYRELVQLGPGRPRRPFFPSTSRQWSLQGFLWWYWRSLTRDFHESDKLEKKLQQF